MTLVLRRREAGMSLVELMVAMLIGLIGIVIITHLYVTNEQYKRSTTGIGSAQINGAVALYTMERDLRMAGYGVAHSMALNCRCPPPPQPLCSPLQYYYDKNSSFPPAAGAAGALPARTPVPVVITNNAVGGPDEITVLYSVANERMLPAQVKEDTALPNHDYKVESWEGFRPDNLVMVSDPGTNTCVLRQLTAVRDTTHMLEHRDGGFYNPAGNIHPVMRAGSAVFNLGNPDQVVWRRYFVNGNKLTSEDLLRTLAGEANAVQPLIDDIVDLQAEYGWDGTMANTDPALFIVDNWSAAPPIDPTDPTKTKILWERIIAVRVGVLARSPNYEKPSTAGGACEATTVAPTWADGKNFTIPDGLPSCYKYRAFELVIPLRNMIWRSS